MGLSWRLASSSLWILQSKVRPGSPDPLESSLVTQIISVPSGHRRDSGVEYEAKVGGSGELRSVSSVKFGTKKNAMLTEAGAALWTLAVVAVCCVIVGLICVWFIHKNPGKRYEKWSIRLLSGDSTCGCWEICCLPPSGV